MTVAQSVERSLETRGVAGSTPAGHITRLRSSTKRQSARLLTGRVQVRRLPGSSPGRAAKTSGPPGLGGSTPSPSALQARPADWPMSACSIRRGRVGKTRGRYPRERRFEPCRRSTRSVRRLVSRMAATTPGRSRGKGLKPVPQGRRRGSRPGRPTRSSLGRSLHLAVGEVATPPALDAGDRRFESCQPDLPCAVEERLSSRAS